MANEIILIEDGPAIIRAEASLQNEQGDIIATKKDSIALCRCGASKSKPFCDGSHMESRFKAQAGKILLKT